MDLANKLRQATVKISLGGKWWGTGFFFTPDLVLTADHNPRPSGKTHFDAWLHDGRQIQLEWIVNWSSDEDHADIAVMRIVNPPQGFRVEPLSCAYFPSSMAAAEEEAFWKQNNREVWVYGYPCQDLLGQHEELVKGMVSDITPLASGDVKTSSGGIQNHFKQLLVRSPDAIQALGGISGGPAFAFALGSVAGVVVMAKHESQNVYISRFGPFLDEIGDDTLRQHFTEVYPRQDPAKYLDKLHAATAHIEIRGVHIGQKEAFKFGIDQIYTALTAVFSQPEPGTAQPERDARMVALQHIVQQERRIVLVGDPGAGKTTFLKRIAFASWQAVTGASPEAAREFLGEECGRFPLWLDAKRLADYIRRQREAGDPSAGDAADWVARCLAKDALDNDQGLDAAFFRRHLNDGCLLMIDGLDEAPDELSRASLARLAGNVAGSYQKTRIVVTSRPPAFGGQVVIGGFETIHIADLDQQGIDDFFSKWCAVLYMDNETLAGQHKDELIRAVNARPEIRRMAVNPLMLTALAVLYYHKKRLPDKRVELYNSVINWLAEARKEKEDRASPSLCLRRMRQLAFWMHTQEKGIQGEISPLQGARALVPEFRDRPEEERATAAEAFLAEEQIDSGIIISRDGKIRFWHRTFQEYLAARALALKKEEYTRLLIDQGKIYDPGWRETVLLLAGILVEDQEQLDDLLEGMLKKLGAKASLAERARCVGLIGRIAADLRSWKYEVPHPSYKANLSRVLAIFEREQAREIPFQVRLEAAEALGQAGDPRLEEDNWVRAEGGTFWMGAQKEDPKKPNYDPEAYEDEGPVRQVTVAPFAIGRYPVTVREYDQFMEDSGYGGEKPGSWGEQQRHPNRPVVEVSWYEASAYCAWKGGRLPTEAEWECAARSGREGVRYPWGNKAPDEHRANFSGGPRHPTPVGLYPEGGTPDGIQDLAGNVLEWTADWYGRYPSGAQVDPKGPASGERRVLRGGSWNYFVSRFSRVSNRFRDVPQVRDYSVGFRCARE